MTKCDKKQEKCDYSKTVIYQIECKDPNITKTYGGHSTNLIKRRALHKSACNNPNCRHYTAYVFQFIRENGGWDNWQVVWQYDYPCENIEQAKLEETKFIKEQKCELNSNRPFITKEDRKEYQKEWEKEKNAKKTEEEKKIRLKKVSEKNKKCKAKIKANETEEEKKIRLQKKREYNATARAKKKAEKESQTNLMVNAELKTI